MELKLDDDLESRLLAILLDDKSAAKHENYVTCVDIAEEMGWHVYGNCPAKLLNRVRPREDPAITQYRIESYEPTTMSVCGEALSIVHKIFNANLYSIRFKEDEKSQMLKKYTMEDYPRFNNIVNYMANFVLKKMIADPNAVILVQPYKYDIKGTDRVQPIATVYASKDVHLYTDDYYFLFDKKVDGEKQKIFYYTYVDLTGVYKLEITLQKDNQSKWQLSYEVIAESVNNFKAIPVWSLGGNYSEKNEGVLESFFQMAKPFWNKAINDDSDVDGAYRMHMWPQKWEVQDECEYVEQGEGANYPCNGGYIFNGSKKYPCPSCRGTGHSIAKSPYETHVINKDKFSGENTIPVPGVGYIIVPTDATKMLEEKAEKNLDKGLRALNMYVVNEIGLNQSGKAKEMDRTELNQFLQRIADVCFEVHLTNLFYFFVCYMFGVELAGQEDEQSEIEPEISKPTQFDIYSTAELTTSLAKAKTAKLNPSYIQTKQEEIINREFSTNPELRDELLMILSLDPLPEVTRDEVSAMIADGTIQESTGVIHDNIIMFVRRALEEKDKFVEMELSEKMAILETYADEVVEANKIKIDDNMIAPQEPIVQPVK